MLEIDYRWKDREDKPEQEDSYLLGVSCGNCGEKHIGKMGKGEKKPYPSLECCPFCGVRDLYFGTTAKAMKWLKEAQPQDEYPHRDSVGDSEC